MGEYDRELGKVDQRLTSLEKRMATSCEKLDELLKMKQQLEGGKKAVTFLVATAATVGAAVSYAAQHIDWRG